MAGGNVILLAIFYFYLFQIHSSDLISKTFRCQSGEYIKNSSYCDSTSDCADGSDEPSGCRRWQPSSIPKPRISSPRRFTSPPFRIVFNQRSCGPGKFRCKEERNCIDVNLVCDTRNNCTDGSDESNCGDEINVQNCSLSDGKYLCSDELRCLGLEYLCDGVCHCFDCSDEKSQCSVVDEDLLKKCPHTYFPTPDGPRCFCNSSDDTFDKLCAEIQNCTDENYCDQRCSRYKSKIMCSCYDNYEEIPGTGGLRCRSKTYYGNMLLYSTPSKIKMMNLTSMRVTEGLSHVESAALAASARISVKYIYFTTYKTNRKIIYQSYYPFVASATEIIHSNRSITAFAIDYITRNIYYTSDYALSVCTNWGGICTQLKCCNTTYVALAPKFKLMFYTKRASYGYEVFIMKSGMDGSNERYLVDGSFEDGTALTVDESIHRLYWWEKSRNQIHSVSFYEKNNEIRTLTYAGSLKSFTAFDGKLLFTKTRDNEIYTVKNIERFSKRVKSNSTSRMRKFQLYGSSLYDLGVPLDQLVDTNATLMIDGDLTYAITYIHAFNPIEQTASLNQNPCKNATCRNLCVLSPSSLSKGFRCLCEKFKQSGKDNWCTSETPKPVQWYIMTTPVSALETTTQSNIPRETISRPNQFSGTSSEEHESEGHPVLKGFFIIVVLVGIGCGVYFVYNRTNWYTYYITVMNWGWTKNTERVNLDREEL